MKRHLIQVHKTKFKKKKNRKTRSDAGKPKDSIAASLSGITVNKELKDLIEKQCMSELQVNPFDLNNSEKSKEVENDESTSETNNKILLVNCDILDSTSKILGDTNSFKTIEFITACSNVSSEIV